MTGRARYGAPMVQMGFRCPVSVADVLEDAAVRAGTTRSDLVLNLLIRAIREQARFNAAIEELRSLTDSVSPGIAQAARRALAAPPVTPSEVHDEATADVRKVSEAIPYSDRMLDDIARTAQDPGWHGAERPDPATCSHSRKSKGASGLLRCDRCHKLIG